MYTNCLKQYIYGTYSGHSVPRSLQAGMTSLMYASGIGNAECVKVLIDGGAQTNLKEMVRQI